MIIKKIKSAERRRGKETSDYIRDAAGDPDADGFGQKVNGGNWGALNCFSGTWLDAAKEISDAEKAYSGSGSPVAHWVLSWKEGEKPTLDQESEAWEIFLKHQNMQDHMILFVGHNNTQFYHSHAIVCRVKPWENERGRCEIQNFGGSETRLGVDGKRRTDEIHSAHRAVAQICAQQGWDTSVNIFDEHGVRKPSADKVRLGQKITAAEAQNGQPHPRREMAEFAIDCLKKSTSQADAQRRLAEKALSLHINNDRRRPGGVIGGPSGERIYLSSLTKDCSLRNLQRRWESGGSAEVEKPAAAPADAGDSFYIKNRALGAVKKIARQCLDSATSLGDAQRLLSEHGLKIEKQGKSGAYLRFGPGESDKIKLSSLGGKYSLHALQKKFNVNHQTKQQKTIEVNANKKAKLSKSIEISSQYTAKAAQRLINALTGTCKIESFFDMLDTIWEGCLAAKELAEAREREADVRRKLLWEIARNDAPKERNRVKKETYATKPTTASSNLVKKKQPKQKQREDKKMAIIEGINYGKDSYGRLKWLDHAAAKEYGRKQLYEIARFVQRAARERKLRKPDIITFDHILSSYVTQKYFEIDVVPLMETDYRDQHPKIALVERIGEVAQNVVAVAHYAPDALISELQDSLTMYSEMLFSEEPDFQDEVRTEVRTPAPASTTSSSRSAGAAPSQNQEDERARRAIMSRAAATATVNTNNTNHPR